MKKELLAPVGNMETLYQAIHNGADAVYLGGKRFGARKFAGNFDDTEMVQAIEYCHLYGVKIYVTVNTMIYEEEIDSVLDYLKFLHTSGVDAVIMQDIGIIKKTREILPNLEIHASTQLHTHNQEQVSLLKELGVKRVVVAREMSIEEINRIDTDLEIEAFIHGALCVCYSGQCLFSSLLLNRSGNRGECAGICRLPFDLIEENKQIKTKGNYILSPKELNTLNHIPELMKSNITSFKIEGRMKSPTTIGFITRLYRTLIDAYNNNQNCTPTEEEIEQLKVLFNREFTDGYLFSKSGNEIMNIKSPNHIGIPLGEIIEVNKKRIRILLSRDIQQSDGIQFPLENKGMNVNFLYNKKGLLINSAKKGEIIEIDNKLNIEKIGPVRKTIDSKLLKELETYKERKIPITMVASTKGKDFILSVSDGTNQITMKKSIVEDAKNKPISEESIKEKLKKVGSTVFEITDLKLLISDNIFISIKQLNELRREILDELTTLRKKNKKEVVILPEIVHIPECEDSENKLHVLVRTEEQLKVCLEEKINNIYVTDEDLYKQYESYDNVYLRSERVKKNHPYLENKRLLIGETGDIFAYRKTNQLVSDYYLNVANHETIDYLLKQNIKQITLSIECSEEQVSNIVSYYQKAPRLEIIIYGYVEVMVTKYCPLKMLVNNDKVPCQVCKNKKQYYLKDRNQAYYPLIQQHELTHILHYKPIDKNPKPYLLMGIKNFRIELWKENSEETKILIKKYQNYLIKE
ncbi:MAG: U32 family peptidase [Firmicutes bacterium]|nr:U32 family peptidase [Bacillota bacterium]